MLVRCLLHAHVPLHMWHHSTLAENLEWRVGALACLTRVQLLSYHKAPVKARNAERDSCTTHIYLKVYSCTEENNVSWLLLLIQCNDTLDCSLETLTELCAQLWKSDSMSLSRDRDGDKKETQKSKSCLSLSMSFPSPPRSEKSTVDLHERVIGYNEAKGTPLEKFSLLP